jgi:hypothetical protein
MSQPSKKSRQKYWASAKGKACQQRYADSHPNRHASANAKHRYGITAEEYARLKKQATHCPVCGVELIDEPVHKSNNSKVLDHCHETGKLRGFTCKRCNVAMGLLNDDPELCRKAAAWLST